MTLLEAMSLQPPWIVLWLYWLAFAILFLPLTLLFWKQTRLAALVALACVIAGAWGALWVYGQFGYVKLLGLPHIIFWTPLSVYFHRLIRRADMPLWPRRIMTVVLVSLLISLAFDYTDALRYLLGERTPLASPA